MATVLITADKEHAHHCGKFSRPSRSEGGVWPGSCLRSLLSLPAEVGNRVPGTWWRYQTCKEAMAWAPDGPEGFSPSGRGGYVQSRTEPQQQERVLLEPSALELAESEGR